MAAKSKIISPEVRKVLSSLEWDGQNAKITCGQLDRKLYQQVNDVLETFGGKWNKKAKAHIFAEDASEELDAAVETGFYVSAADLKQVFGEFETPDSLAEELVARAGIAPGHWVLEPSAGSGQIIRAIHRLCGALGTVEALETIDAVEVQSKNHAKLSEIADAVFIEDFLKWKPLGYRYNRIVMNPPFAKQADIDHVAHAYYECLAPKGKLVAIMSPGFTFRDNHKSKAFRELVEENGNYTEIEAGAFKVSGTNIRTVMVTLEKN